MQHKPYRQGKQYSTQLCLIQMQLLLNSGDPGRPCGEPKSGYEEKNSYHDPASAGRDGLYLPYCHPRKGTPWQSFCGSFFIV